MRTDSTIVREWYSHLEIFIFSRPKVIGHFRQYLLLQKDILQKTVAFLLSGTYFCAPRRSKENAPRDVYIFKLHHVRETDFERLILKVFEQLEKL